MKYERHRYALNIPVELGSWVLETHFYRPMQLYICLKHQCSGKIKFEEGDLKRVAEEIGLTTERAVRNNLKILLKKNWVGFNKKTKIYFIRGFEHLRRMYGMKSRTAAEFDCRDIKKLKGFLAAARMQYMIHLQKKGKRATESKTRGSKQIARSVSSYHPIANKALAIVLGVSISNAYELKQLAFKDHFIDIRRTHISTDYKSSEAQLFKVAWPEIAGRVRVRKNEVVLQDIDHVSSTVLLKKRKKLETYTQG